LGALSSCRLASATTWSCSRSEDREEPTLRQCERGPRDALDITPPRLRRGVGSTIVIPLPRHDRQFVLGRRWRRSRLRRVLELRACRSDTTRRQEVTRPGRPPPPLGCFHMGCSPQEGHCHSGWTTLRRHSPGRYAQTPKRMWKDQWSSHVTPKHGRRRPSCRTSPGYEASAA